MHDTNRRRYGFSRPRMNCLSATEIVGGIVILLYLGLVLHTLAPSVSVSDIPPEAQGYQTKKACEDTECWIVHYSNQYNVDSTLSLRIAMCESSLDPYARNPNSTASGLYQITRGTFLDGVKKRGFDWEANEVFDVHKNIDMALWYMSNGETWRWNASKHCWRAKS